MSDIAIRHDIRDRFGPARDQGARETCLAFATSDAHAFAIGGSWLPLSCEYLFYYAKTRDKAAVTDGTTISAIRAALEHDGQPIESDWPYLSKLPVDLKTWAPPTSIGTLFRRKSENGVASFSELWNSIESDLPRVMGMTTSAAFFSPTVDGIVDSGEPIANVRHAVLVVGNGQLKKDRVVLVRNSWGPTWGLSGHAWVSERYLVPRIKFHLAIK